MQSKAPWLDFIKVFGVLATIFLHTNSRLVNFQTSIVNYPVELNMFYWDIGVVFASLVGPSFALIFMYLGATVLSSSHNSISFFMSKIDHGDIKRVSKKCGRVVSCKKRENGTDDGDTPASFKSL